jgi:translation initiation factor IF-3
LEGNYTKDTKELRINRQISSPEVRVIDPDGKQIGILTVNQAIIMAEQHGLDLVEVSPSANPPVCRILDYGKFKYQRSKKSQASKKKRVQSLVHVKEVKLRPMTEEHDFQFKLRHIKKFLTEGNKAKVSMVFRGREITHPELGREIFKRITEAVSDIGTIEQEPRMEGRNMIMLLTPKTKSSS